MVPTSRPARSPSSRSPDRPRRSAADRGSESAMPDPGPNVQCASGSPMTRTSPAAERPSVAADEGTLRALEFGAIVQQLAELTSFEPARELALASVPSPDAAHVALLQDQTDEAGRLLDDQAQASIGGARDIRGSLDRA